MRAPLICSLIILLLSPAVALSANSAVLQSVQTYGNLHAGGVVATITGDDNRNASAELLWRQVGESSFRTGHPLARIDATHFVGSLFWLNPGVSYEVQVTVSDADGVSGSPSPVTSLVTRSESLPEPSIRTLYVATSGSDSSPGTDPGAPLRTIQRAANLSQPGDLILIQPGVYRESVSVPRSGTATQPIVFRGNGDGVILDGSDGTIAAGGTWTIYGNGIYSRVTGFPTSHVVTDLGRLYAYGSLTDLQSLGAGVPGGFYFDGTTLYVKFSDGSSPASHTFYVARLEEGFSLYGLSQVRIENVEIRYYGSGGYGKGIYLSYCSDIVVRYCKIHEVEAAGVWIKGGDRHRIEDNEFWDTSVFNWPWSFGKASSPEITGIRFTDEAGRGHVMRRNTIHGTFNGIGIDSNVAPASGVTNEIDVYENVLYQHLDDAFEPEGPYTSNFRFWSNQVKDVHMAFSLAPVGIGPVWVIYNVVYRHGNIPSSLTDASFLKINNGFGTDNGPIFLYHNTVFTDAPSTNAIRIMEPAHSPFITLRNNILAGTLYVLEIDATVSAGLVGVDMNGDNLYSTDTTRLVKWFNNTKYTSLGAFGTGTGQELQGLSVQPTFVNPAGGDFRLPAGSALIDAGVLIPGINDDYVGNGPDIGAYEYGLDDDTTPPVISSVASSGITSSGATITWSTNEASDSQVEYGLTTSYGSSTTLNTSLVTSHSVVLSGLSASTTYHYRVKSKDAASNLAVSGDYSFTTAALLDTTPPVISSVASSGVTSSGATITWSTNEASDSQVEYGLTTGYGSSTTLDASLVTNHSVALSGLSASTTYHYRVKSKDASANAAVSSDYSLTTSALPDTQPPVISNVASSGVTSSGATITWSTNEASDSQVEYGLTIGYGSSTTLDASLVTNHSVALSGLSASTTYHYRVKSKDGATNLATSGDYSFTTSAQPSGGWDGYGYRRPITIDYTKVTLCSSNLSNFPVLVSLSGTWLKTTGNGGSIYSSNGYDIIFKASDGVTQLDHEVEKYDGSGGTLVAWVRVPTLSYTTNTTIYIYYGNSGISTDQSNPTGVWDSNFVAVWHLKEDPSGGAPQMKNSKSGSYHGTSYGSMATGDQVAGKIGGSLDMDGIDDRISVGTIIGNSSPFTVSLWFKSSSSNKIKLWGEGRSTTTTPLIYLAANENVVGDVDFGMRDDVSAGASVNYNPGNMNNGNWHYLVGAQSSKSSREFFVDGISRGTSTQTVGTITLDRGTIGAQERTSVQYFLPGGIDEVRISNSARSACWVGTEYNSQNSPSTFSALGNEETPPTGDSQPPVISSVASSGVTSSGATITWTTNEASDSQVEYGPTTSYGSSTTLNTSMVTSHSVALSGLSASTTYHYRVKSKDAAPNAATSGDYSFTTSAAPDTTPPVISSVASSGVTSSGATITWTTNEASDSQVEYGLTTSYGSSTTLNTSMVTSHSVALSGLTASTTYHYRVKSKDAAANAATSGDYSFTTSAAPDTTPPVISSVASSGITSSGATITWTTNEASDSQVEYGLTTSYGSSTTLNTSMVTSHSVALSGLTASTTYHYRVKSKDAAANAATSGDYSFTTSAAPDTTPPVISSVASSGITSSGATITWTTNEASDSQVEYGLTTSYGSSTTLNTSMVTSHSVVLSGLTASTTYHYRVKSKDAAGNLATSGDYSCTTSAPPDTQAPTVPTNLTATAVSSTQINLSWTASTDNVGVAGYRIYRGGTQIATTAATSYQDTGRSPSTPYTYTVAAYDAAGNASAQSSPASATTQAAPDTQAPTVPTGLSAIVVSSTQINLSWTASTDNVGVTGYKIYQNGPQIGTTAGTSYQSTGLKANTSYSYRVAAYDGAGNTSAKSATVTQKTQPAPSTKFTIGDRVQTISNATVRSAPSSSGTSSGTQLKGAMGRVAGGPWYWNLQWWWQIDFDSGTDGWVAQGKLQKVS